MKTLREDILMLKNSKYFTLLGPLFYVVVWLFFMPIVAEVSTAAAILSLTLLTGVYCFAVARINLRNEVLWSILGALAAFVEFGLIPVVIISLLPRKNMTDAESEGRSLTHAT